METSAGSTPQPNKLIIPPGYLFVKQTYLEKLEALIRQLPPFSLLWSRLDRQQQQQLASHIPFSTSQLAQDLFVISETCKRDIPPFFVEVGATNGITLSNSYILETRLHWQGIVVEPARTWHTKLSENRQCLIDTRCVTDKSQQMVDFLETGISTPLFQNSSPALSSIASFADSGDWAADIRRANSKRYEVPTVSFDDLLAQHGAPHNIGYLSLDTEGSELMILQGHNFASRRIAIVTVEHNFNEIKRRSIYELMTKHGYSRVHTDISRWDDWYVLSS